MLASRNSYSRRPFVITGEDTRYFFALLEEEIGEPAISIDCADGITRRFEGIDEMLRFDNPNSKSINGITFKARSSDHESEARVAFSHDQHVTISLQLDGQEAIVSKLNNGLEDRIDHMRPWWSLLVRVNFVVAAFVMLFLLIFVALVLNAVGTIETIDTGNGDTGARREALGWLGALALTFGTLGFGALLQYLRSRLFPIATFAVGMGRDRYRRQERWRWVVIVGFLVSLTAGIVASNIGGS